MASTPAPETTASGTTRPGWLKKSSLGFYRNGGTLSEDGHCSYKQTGSPCAPQGQAQQMQRNRSGRHTYSSGSASPDLGSRSRRLGRVDMPSTPEMGFPQFDDWLQDGRRSASESDTLRKISETSVSSVDSQDSRIEYSLSTE